MKSLFTDTHTQDKEWMIFCNKSDSLALQAVLVWGAAICLVYEAIDLLLCKSNIGKQIQDECIHLNSGMFVLLQSISSVNHCTVCRDADGVVRCGDCSGNDVRRELWLSPVSYGSCDIWPGCLRRALLTCWQRTREPGIDTVGSVTRPQWGGVSLRLS